MLSDEDLLIRLDRLNRLGRRLDAQVIELLIQVEDRRLDRLAACPSLYEFCRRKLGMSEGTANRRVVAVRLVRRIPALLSHLENGTLTLSALVLVKNVITTTNFEDIIEKVAGKTRDEIEELVACMAPKPDVEARLRLLPQPHANPPGSEAASGVEPTEPPAAPHPSARAEREGRARLAPLAEARWRLQLTANKALRDKIERARELMRHRNPSGDLTVVIHAAIDALLETLETSRKEVRSSPRRRTVKAGAVALAIRRAVFARDGEQCTYRNARGERCSAKSFLEIDHIDPRARGGSGELANLRVRCRAHNMLHAEESFGRAHIERRIRERRAPPEGRAAGAAAKRSADRTRAVGEPRAGP